jgi:DNA-binding MarR family transcriptional regulator
MHKPMKRTRGLRAFVQMIRTFGTLQSLVDASLSEYDLTLAQFNLMVTLSFREGLNQNELANHLGVTKGNIVGLLNRLSRRGLVQRVNVEGDHRVNLVRLTHEGRKLISETLPEQLSLVVKMMKPLSLAELEALEASLKRLEEGNVGAENTRVSAMPPIAFREGV